MVLPRDMGIEASLRGTAYAATGVAAMISFYRGYDRGPFLRPKGLWFCIYLEVYFCTYVRHLVG